MKTLADVQTDATTLHALAQGAFELLELTPTPATPAANALYGVLVALIERADTLAGDLGNLAERVKAGNAERNFSNTGTAGWVGTLILGGVTDLGTTAGVLGGTYLGSRALTSTTFLKALNSAARGDARMMKAMANGNGPFRKDAATVMRLAGADHAVGEPEKPQTYRATGPDGKTYTFQLPKNATREAIQSALRAAIAARP